MVTKSGKLKEFQTDLIHETKFVITCKASTQQYNNYYKMNDDYLFRFYPFSCFHLPSSNALNSASVYISGSLVCFLQKVGGCT